MAVLAGSHTDKFNISIDLPNWIEAVDRSISISRLPPRSIALRVFRDQIWTISISMLTVVYVRRLDRISESIKAKSTRDYDIS